jgi:mRNA-degrading endonuclease toxin of MazEF toxin-antitoxin module
MKRFDVCRAEGPGVGGKGRLVVILQHQHFDDLATIMVAPLYMVRELPAVERLRPTVSVGKRRYRAAVDRMAAIPRRQLGTAVANAESARYELLGAIDLLFSGF